MNTKILGKKEYLFIIMGLSLISILAIVKFIIALAKISNFVSLANSANTFEGISLSEFNTYRAILIVMLCFSFISLIISFIFLAIRNKNANNALLIINMTILVLISLFYFVIKYSCGELFSINTTDSMYILNAYIIDQGLYLMLSTVISVVVSLTAFKLSVMIYENKKSNVIKDSNFIKTDTEIELENEIEKLKSQIRIKKLEEEYVRLKNEVDN